MIIIIIMILIIIIIITIMIIMIIIIIIIIIIMSTICIAILLLNLTKLFVHIYGLSGTDKSSLEISTITVNVFEYFSEPACFPNQRPRRPHPSEGRFGRLPSE